MTRFRIAWAALTVFAATAAGGDPAPDIFGPSGRSEPAKADPPPEVLPDVIIPADGFHPRKHWPPPPPVCEPPTRPGTLPPGMSPPPKDPSTIPPKDPTAPSDPGPAARAPEAGTQPANTLNPNMFGDQFSGAARGLLGRRVSFLIGRNGQPLEFARYQGNVNTRFYSPHQNFPQDFPAQISVEGRTLTVGGPNFQAVNTISPSPGVVPVNPLLENAQVTAILKTLVPQGQAVFVSGTAEEVPTSALVTQHRINQTYDITQTGLALSLPPDGGIVGRTKLSDDNNPLPRDRFIFNYDFYANPILAAGLDVHRFALGMETTFLDRQASFEFRMPIASTLDNLSGAGGLSARDLEYGNLFTAVKGLLLGGDELNISAGLAVSWPTADDAILLAFDGRDFVRVQNESILVAPFLAAIYSPGERFFAQGWIQGSFDATGNPVLTDFDGRGPVEAGRLRDQARILADIQVGYWIYRKSSGDGLRGLAPFFELHYNTTVSDASQVQAPPTTVIGLTNRRFDEVNASVGMTALFGSNMMVMAGLVVPLREGEDRFFDYQFGVRANWFFGPTARAREEADAAGLRPEALPYQTPNVMPAARPAVTQAGGTADAPLSMPTTVVAGAPPVTVPGNYTPGFFGDIVVLSASQGFTRLAGVPGYDGTKPTDRDGPQLSDRFYFGYDRAGDVVAPANPPGQRPQRLTRQMIGFETVFEDRVSVGLRLPFLQADADTDAASVREIGDLTAVFKYALMNDVATGSAVTMGLNLTLPTGGRGDLLAAGEPLPRGVFAQPWLGAVWTAGDLFVQGTSSILLPTNPVYQVALFNSAGAGYWVYRTDGNAAIRGIAPVVEFHATNPLTNRGTEEPLLIRSQVNMTTGLFIQCTRLTAGAAVSIPLLEEKPYDVGGMFTVSYQF
ncbi:MAG TPA: hypothetical protein VM597_18580 [Gemmataceae bacterium]|nr:hypothetical protein [Gemmataceae bacterium]